MSKTRQIDSKLHIRQKHVPAWKEVDENAIPGDYKIKLLLRLPRADVLDMELYVWMFCFAADHFFRDNDSRVLQNHALVRHE